MKNSAYFKPFFVGALCGAGWLLYGIFTSTNSTAPVGLIMMPIFMLLGGLGGAAIAHLALVVMGRKKVLSIESGVVMILTLLVCAKIYSDNKREMYFKEIETTAQREKIDLFLRSEDDVVVGTLATNTHLTEGDLHAIIKRWGQDYSIMSRVIEHKALTVEMMTTLARNIPGGNPEGRLYQTFVLAPLMRRDSFPEELFHEVANRIKGEHFLALAIIESSRSTCDEIRPYTNEPNDVLANTAIRALERKNCP